MFKNISIRESILFSICLLLSYFVFIKKWDNVQLKEDKIRAEEKIKEYEVDSKIQHSITDSLKTKVQVIEGVIEYQKLNPKIIIKKYDKVRNNVNMLNIDESIGYLSARLSKESGN